MAYWHIRINGLPWCCHGELDTEQSPALRAALLNLCCGQASRADALSVKTALAETGCAKWDEIEIVREGCEIKHAKEEAHGGTTGGPGTWIGEKE